MRGGTPERPLPRNAVIVLCCGLIWQCACWALSAYISFLVLDHFTHSRWLPYLLPTEAVWDRVVHKGRDDDRNGGVWHTSAGVHRELTCYIDAYHPDYASLLDVSCNLGWMLAHLSHRHPNASHYGTDISRRMVAATQRRCAACKTAPFDLARLARAVPPAAPPSSALDSPLAAFADAPAAVDVVIVSDVLYYMPYDGWAPALLNAQVVPSRRLRVAQRRLFDALTSMARREVVFSDHQSNPAVIDFLTSMGATPLNLSKYGARSRRALRARTPLPRSLSPTVWLAAGTARGTNADGARGRRPRAHPPAWRAFRTCVNQT